MKHIKEIKSARLRAESMGKFHAWDPSFNSHPLAACIDNHNTCIDVEMEGIKSYSRDADAFVIFCWVLNMARAINKHCEQQRVAESEASQYWLERFIWVNSKVTSKVADLRGLGA